MGLFTIRQNDFSIVCNKMDEVENVDAKVFFSTFLMRSKLPLIIHLIERYAGFCPEKLFPEICTEAKRLAEADLERFESVDLPDELYHILDENLYKREQITLLKGLQMSAEQLGGLFIQASERGYKFSNYIYEGIPKSYKEKDFPSFIYLRDDGNIENYGDTELTEGQLKDYVIQSHFIIARILDNDKHWHCFYQTSSGVQGKEPGKFGSKPHLHYISDSFGVEKDEIVKSLRVGCMPSCNKTHILLAE